MIKDSHKRSILKSVVWRMLGIVILSAVTYFYTRHLMITGLITFIHHATFVLVFYLHERFWFKIKKPIGKLRDIIKAFTYEIILGMGIGGLIVLLITGEWAKVTQITFTYTAIKLVLYYFNEILWKRKKVVYTYACGDIIHRGHLRYFQKAKEQGNYLIIGVLSDKAIKEEKIPPVILLSERVELIKNLKVVDEVVIQKTYSPLENVKKIRPDVLVESDSHDSMPANDFVKSYGGEVVIVPYYKKQSSTQIKNKILNR